MVDYNHRGRNKIQRELSEDGAPTVRRSRVLQAGESVNLTALMRQAYADEQAAACRSRLARLRTVTD